MFFISIISIGIYFNIIMERKKFFWLFCILKDPTFLNVSSYRTEQFFLLFLLFFKKIKQLCYSIYKKLISITNLVIWSGPRSFLSIDTSHGLYFTQVKILLDLFVQIFHYGFRLKKSITLATWNFFYWFLF